MEEGKELLRMFFRRWSTIEITDETRPLLKEDVLHVETLLEIYEYESDLLENAVHAPNRLWFAKRYAEHLGSEHI